MSDIAILTERAYEIARRIPPGKVTSYGEWTVLLALTAGHIAKLAGYPNYSR